MHANSRPNSPGCLPANKRGDPRALRSLTPVPQQRDVGLPLSDGAAHALDLLLHRLHLPMQRAALRLPRRLPRQSRLRRTRHGPRRGVGRGARTRLVPPATRAPRATLALPGPLGAVPASLPGVAGHRMGLSQHRVAPLRRRWSLRPGTAAWSPRRHRPSHHRPSRHRHGRHRPARPSPCGRPASREALAGRPGTALGRGRRPLQRRVHLIACEGGGVPGVMSWSGIRLTVRSQQAIQTRTWNSVTRGGRNVRSGDAGACVAVVSR